ncbi:hypothetical protein FJ950_01150 [Mesorhizobium sp. B2-3-14]|uniref:restriction endonuclease subunit S n=1 Tax=Mesorhizobium sp. B2-3-14 TaxID=2589950 RepID=UPI001128BFFA|nr:restriction endonuclease subunit S [Mesorhizobium sp. B2-3-14]TPL88993.1 hypothetical protein FJ950_01150 [Mesorhizobium sp. B2-3-14]
MVPEGWSVRSIGETGKVHAGRQRSPHFTEGKPRTYLRVANVFDGKIDTSDLLTMPFTDGEYERYRLQEGDILLNEGQSLELVGRSAIYRGEPPECCFQNTLVRYRADRKTDTTFAWNLFHHCLHTGVFAGIATKTNSIAHLGVSRFAELKLRFPPLPEQKKIGEILSTWDAAIETSEKLLVNAEAQKRALMQQLLLGKRRLKGFEGTEWAHVKIGSVLKEVRRNVDWSDDDLYSLLSLRRRSRGLFLRQRLHGREILTKGMKTTKAGDFLISKMQVVHGAMAMTPAKYDGMHISNSYISLIPRNKDRLQIRFFDWLSRMPCMYRLAYLSSYGVHIEKMTFNLDWFLEEKIDMPATANEQTRIADVLDAAQCEVDALIAAKGKLLNEKRALMQQLLTGKRRVQP